MSNRKFPILETEFNLPLVFSTPLPFSKTDIDNMSWLRENPRYYFIDSSNFNKKGGRATAFKGYVSDLHGNRLESCSEEVILKVPNIDTINYTVDEISSFLGLQCAEGMKEWLLTRKRLSGCKYANPIIDVQTLHVLLHDTMLQVPVSVQYFLSDALPIEDYLLKKGLRTKPYTSIRKGQEIDLWQGIEDPNVWLEYAYAIAIGLSDIHQRRVIHGDIWPPNIFIKEEDDLPFPIFIDFGESIPLEPRGTFKEMRDHAYRAPERRDSQSLITSASDVYSYGKLLLHLATGKEPIISSTLRGHFRKEFVKKVFLESGKSYFQQDNPFVIDIICQCISLDPIDRPSMSEICRAFQTYLNPNFSFTQSIPLPDKIKEVEKVIERYSISNSDSVSALMQEIVGIRLDDVKEYISGLSNDVILINDTRERIIFELISLFAKLQSKDRFISITHPRMWQGSALGLDGRYLTAAKLAVLRNASVQRLMIISIQELGATWVQKWIENLRLLQGEKSNPNIELLVNVLNHELGEYQASVGKGDTKEISNNQIIQNARNRFRLVLDSYKEDEMSIIKDMFNDCSKFTDSKSCDKMWLSLLPVSTLSVMRRLKSQHPVSVFYFDRFESNDQYLLMRTECVGRNSHVGLDGFPTDDFEYLNSKPELKGLTIFKSVNGIPEDTIKKLEQVFRMSINIGSWINQIYSTLPDIEYSNNCP